MSYTLNSQKNGTFILVKLKDNKIIKEIKLKKIGRTLIKILLNINESPNMRALLDCKARETQESYSSPCH